MNISLARSITARRAVELERETTFSWSNNVAQPTCLLVFVWNCKPNESTHLPRSRLSKRTSEAQQALQPNTTTARQPLRLGVEAADSIRIRQGFATKHEGLYCRLKTINQSKPKASYHPKNSPKKENAPKGVLSVDQKINCGFGRPACSWRSTASSRAACRPRFRCCGQPCCGDVQSSMDSPDDLPG